jgi:galactokinase
LLALRDGDFVAAQQIAKTGAALLLASDIAPRAGLASTGSAVVASVLAWCGMFKIVLTTQQQLALSAQVHANLTCDSTPDGSDLSQVAAALFARESQLQVFDPQTMQRTFVALPDDVTLYGFTCSEYHQNSDDVYRKARCATFMGRRILRDLIPHEMRANDDNLHLANVSVDVWRALRDLIPAKMRGRDFLQQFGDHKDERTEIESETEYSIRLAAEHPIYENARTERFVALLRAAQNNPVAREPLLIAAGELMIQSHCSYDHRYALRSPETNLAVELCRKHGARQGIPGAKLTGRNIGGTVAVLCDKRKNPDIETLLQQIICKYEKQTGKTAQLLTGSSPGALEWNASGVRETNLRELQS